MSVTIAPVSVTLIRWQVDHLGYCRCGDHVDEARGGDIEEREVRDILRSAETDDRELWTCDICHRYVSEWPTRTATVNALIEHTAARIF